MTQVLYTTDTHGRLVLSSRPAHGMNGTYGDYLYAGRAVSVIESHDVTTPLFFYLALQVCPPPPTNTRAVVTSPATFPLLLYLHLPHMN